jgi:hypothetical protein
LIIEEATDAKIQALIKAIKEFPLSGSGFNKKSATGI